MDGRTVHLRRHLLSRRCVACGAETDPLNDASPTYCPCCGTDLLERPARSYAEMEGLIGEETQQVLDASPGRSPSSAARLIERWIFFGFLTLLMLFAIAALASAALQT